MNHIAATIEELKARRAKLDAAIAALEEFCETPTAIAPATRQKRGRKKREALVPVHSNGRIDLSPAREPESDAPKSNADLTPQSDGAIAIGRSLSEPFTTTDLCARLDGPKVRASQWIFRWREKGWIDNAGYGQYRRTPTFGE